MTVDATTNLRKRWLASARVGGRILRSIVIRERTPEKRRSPTSLTPPEHTITVSLTDALSSKRMGFRVEFR